LPEQTVPAPDEIIARLEQALAVDRPRRDLRPTDKIRENLRLDSLALMELLTRIEEQFDIELIDRPELYSAVVTVGDLVSQIQEVLGTQR
jgi:acyl carrier protein